VALLGDNTAEPPEPGIQKLLFGLDCSDLVLGMLWLDLRGPRQVNELLDAPA
jgi:hypothetical protein